LERRLYEYGFVINESKIHIKTDKKKAIEEAMKEIRRQREELINQIREHPEFEYALKPVPATPNAPKIVQIMTEASKIADVGPMAAVAGALADLGLEAMLEAGAKTAVVEDGGEIAAFTSQPVAIMILSSNSSLSGKIGFEITREDCPIGIATSSSKTGHALSFGEADSVTVFAEKAAIADAAATAICNSVVGVNIEKSIERGLDKCKSMKVIRGAIIIREGQIGLTGKLPKFTRVKE